MRRPYRTRDIGLGITWGFTPGWYMLPALGQGWWLLVWRGGLGEGRSGGTEVPRGNDCRGVGAGV